MEGHKRDIAIFQWLADINQYIFASMLARLISADSLTFSGSVMLKAQERLLSDQTDRVKSNMAACKPEMLMNQNLDCTSQVFQNNLIVKLLNFHK